MLPLHGTPIRMFIIAQNSRNLSKTLCGATHKIFAIRSANPDNSESSLADSGCSKVSGT